MDLIYLLGLIIFLYSVVIIVLVFVADSDVVTYLYSRLGKQPDEFKGKVVWVTGASSGIGEAIAKDLAKVGARIVLSARRKEELERVKQECLKISTLKEREILVLPLDVTALESHEPSLKTVLKYFGKLDVLLSNAGQFQYDTFADIEMLVDRHIFEINVFSVVNMNRLVVKYFLEKGGGQVGVVSSTAGKIGRPFSSTYNASKHAIHGYFDSLRMETYGKNVNVTIICPGVTETPIFEKLFTNQVGKLANLPKQITFSAMAVERCSYLSLVAMANRLNESWIAKHPMIPFLYMCGYFSLLADLYHAVSGRKKISKIREQLLNRRNISK